MFVDRDPGGDSLSGGYLFLPDGPAKTLSAAKNSFVRLVGPLRQTLIVCGPAEAKIQQEIRLDAGAYALDIVNTVDVRKFFFARYRQPSMTHRKQKVVFTLKKQGFSPSELESTTRAKFAFDKSNAFGFQRQQLPLNLFLGETANFELAMRLTSRALDADDRQFFTDLNGLEVRIQFRLAVKRAPFYF